MSRRKAHREKDLTTRYLRGDWDEDRIEQEERFSERFKTAEQDKIQKTAQLRQEIGAADLETLPIGRVVQVYSLWIEVEHEGVTRRCVVRKTLQKLADTAIVVGDYVRFRDMPAAGDGAAREGVIEDVLPRQTILTRADSFKGTEQHPIVANAEQMLIVAALAQPAVKWGLIDRMLIAAQAGGLAPIVCLNKVDLGEGLEDARTVLAHYESMGIKTIQTSAESNIGIDQLRDWLRGHETVLAGHSGVGKSSLVARLEPGLDIRVGEISAYTGKGRHTTSSARRYPLSAGGAVIDTPGVKLFGLWGVTRENLPDFFPDVASGAAPQWRQESFERIAESLR